MLVINMDPQNLKNISCVQEAKCNIQKMFQIVPFVVADLFWKFHESPLIQITVMLLTNMTLHLNKRPRKSLVSYETV